MKLKDLEMLCGEILNKKECGHFYLDLNGVFKILTKLLAVVKAVKELPWGESPSLPWCLESFPKLKKALEELESLE